VGIEGVSRYGKAALVAMAFEPRFAMGLIGSSGAGGATPHRRDFGEKLENLTGMGAYHWFAGNFIKYGAEKSSFGRRDAKDVPVEAHQLIAMSAPRPLFISYGIPEMGDAHWLDQLGSYRATVAAGEVYRLLGTEALSDQRDYRQATVPEVNVGLLDGVLAWRQHDGGHEDRTNMQHFVDWADGHIQKEDTQILTAKNPVIWADVPDVAVIRVGDTYYMSSTTMHLSPGLPIMKSKDLLNWELLGYVYDTLADNAALRLEDGKNAYGAGSWASSLRYHQGNFYVSTFSATSGRTHIYVTDDIEGCQWEETSFEPALHDHSLVFGEDGRVYMLYGGGDLRLVELEQDLSGIKQDGFNEVVIERAHEVATSDVMLHAEGTQVLKVDGRYYVMNICWPNGGMRTQIVHRSESLTGPFEGKVVLQDKGVAQGCLIDTPEGEWYAVLFQDNGAVGRSPWLVPVVWEEG